MVTGGTGDSRSGAQPDVPLRVDVVESQTGHEWTVTLTSPEGGTTLRIPAPFETDELSAALNGVEMAFVRSSSPVVTRRAASPARVARDFGSLLTDTLFAGDARILFDRCRREAKKERVPFRVLLDVTGSGVSRIPWELVVDPDARDDFLALRVPVVRSPRLMHRVPPLHVDPPLRVLGVMSRPSDLPELEAEKERVRISGALERHSSDAVHVAWLPGDRWADLSDALRGSPWHVLHFIGHGGFDEDSGTGFLEFTDDDGAAMRVSATDLGRLVAENPDLRLVVLNACESATAGAEGMFSSTAAKLMREGLPAVVAMQYEVSDAAALTFACAFYEEVAKGVAVDRAVTRAREQVKTELSSLEWATPVLFLASDETRVFTVAGTRDEAVAQPLQSQPAEAQPAETQPAETQPTPPAATQPSSWAPASTRPPAPAAPVTVARFSAGSGGISSEWTSQVRARVRQFLSGSGAQGDVTVPVPRRGAGPSTAGGPPSQVVDLTRRGPDGTRTGNPSPRTALTGPPLSRVRVLAAAGPCRHAALGPRDLVAVACADGGVRVAAWQSGRVLAQCTLPSGDLPVHLAWSPWPRHIASAHAGGTVAVWDLETEVPLRLMRVGGAGAQRLAFSRSGRWLAVAVGAGVRVFDGSGSLVRTLVAQAEAADPDLPTPPLRAVTDLAFTPDERRLLVAADDGVVRGYDVRGDVTARWRHPRAVTVLASTDDGLATGCLDGRVRLWSEEGRVRGKTDPGSAVVGLTWAADGTAVAAASADGGCRVLDATGHVVAETALAGPAVGLGLAAADRSLLTVTGQGDMEVWTWEPTRHPGAGRT